MIETPNKALTYLLQLGRESELCLYEARALAQIAHGDVSPAGPNLALLSLPEGGIGVREFCNEPGGLIRAIAPFALAPGQAVDSIAESGLFAPHGAWAVSCLSPGLQNERESVRQAIRAHIKNSETARGREERVPPHESELAPSRVCELGLDRSASEICLWRSADKSIGIGKTVWVYSQEEFSERDVGKPMRPRKRGLLPPKLARQLINLARHAKTRSLLDPFCGSGVTLLEGLSMGFKVMGSDNREEALEQSRKNLAWYDKSFRDTKGGGIDLKRVDARQLSNYWEPLSMDAIVGEGDLGPPIVGHLPRKTAFEIAKSLEALYVTAFAEIRTVLKPGGYVSLALPFWQPSEGDEVFINIDRRLGLIGYEPRFPERELKPLLYRRKDQRVGRAIYCLRFPE